MTFDDRIKNSIEEALGSARLPPGDLRAVEHRGRRIQKRRRRRAVTGAAVGVLAVTLGAATLSGGIDRAEPAPASPGDVDCAGGVVQTMPREQPRVPSYSTALEAAQAWAGPDSGRLEMDGEEFAYLLRDDGSVRARMRLESSRADLEDREPSAWTVDGSQTCDDETSTEPWNGASLLECASGRPLLGQVQYDVDEEYGSFPTEPEAFTIDARDTSALFPTLGAMSGDVTATTSRNGNVHTVVRLLRIADLWRITQIAECATQAPGVKPPPDGAAVELVNLQTGHCWLDPLRYDGRTWEARAEDDFGDGGGGELWHGFGTVTSNGDGLKYVDLGGKEVPLLPTDHPGIAEKTFCA